MENNGTENTKSEDTKCTISENNNVSLLIKKIKVKHFNTGQWQFQLLGKFKGILYKNNESVSNKCKCSKWKLVDFI